MFFSFDGIDGTGKSTQMRLFCESLRACGLDIVECRDPGTTRLGEQIRDILLTTSSSTPIDRMSEMLLYMAARAQLVAEVIRPAIAADKVVVSDRYLLANIVYQGYAGGLDPDVIRQIGSAATDHILPDCVFLLDLPPETAEKRLNRALDRMERQNLAYRTRLRDGFITEARRADSHAHVIDADRPIADVQADIWRIAAQQCGLPPCHD